MLPQHDRNVLFAAIKLDLVDAFGAVDIEQLRSIIESDKSFLTPMEKKLLIKRFSNAFVNITIKKKSKEIQKVYEWNHGK